MGFIPTTFKNRLQIAIAASQRQQQQAIAASSPSSTFDPSGAVVLETGDGGQQGLSNFLGQNNNNAAPAGILRSIQPGIDLRDFMRRFKFSNWSGAAAIGDKVQQVAWTVPIGEFWRLRNMWYHNLDSGAHSVNIRVTFNNDSTFPAQYMPVFTRVLADVQKVIYGNIWEGTQGSGDNGFFSGLIPVVLEPGDVITFQDEDAYSTAVTAAGGIIYEIVPEPSKRTVRGPDASVIIAP